MKKTILFLFFLILSACTGKMPEATVIPTIQQETPIIIFTPEPSLTPSLTTPSPPFTPQTNDTPEIVPPITETKQVDSCEKYGKGSPLGTWVVFRCGEYENQTMEFISKEGKKWVVAYKDYIPEESLLHGNSPRGRLYPAHWTNDENYLYFTAYVGMCGGGYCLYGKDWADALYRINLNTGSITATLPDNPNHFYYTISFSPNGHFLAYDSATANQTIIYNLQTGEEIVIEEGISVGDFSWSSDSKEFAYGTCIVGFVGEYESEKESTVKIYSLDTHTSKTIIKVENDFLRIEKTNILLEISGNRIETNIKNHFFYNWNSGQLTTPTPSE